MNKKNFCYLFLFLCISGCTTISVNLDSDPHGASVYKGKVENGPWERVIGSSNITPMTVDFYSGDYLLKAKKYGYDDSKIIKVSDLQKNPTHMFQLSKLVERRYDPFYETSVTKITLPVDKKRNIAVMNFNVKGNVEEDRGYYVGEFVQDLLLKTEGFNIVDRKNVQNILKELKFQMSGSTSNEKVVEVGKMLNVQEMVYGSIGYLGSNYIITFNIVDVETGKVLYTGNRMFQKDEEMGKSLVEIVNDLIDKRFGK